MISIIICSINPARFSAVAENYRRLLGEHEHEMVLIDDAQSLCEGYNRGIARARGDVLIISHDDVEIHSADFKQKLLSRLEQFDLLGVSGATKLVGPQWNSAGPPYTFGQSALVNAQDHCLDVLIWGAPRRVCRDIRVMDGVFLAGRRNVFESIRFDQETFTDFHMYDLDFTFRAYQSGRKLAICNDFGIIHFSQGNYGPSWSEQAERFKAKHAAHFETIPSRRYSFALVKVQSREDALQVMNPPGWD